MKKQFERTASLVGEENIAVLGKSKVAVFGVGGVGSYATEALIRAGIGEVLLVDNDIIVESNLNRQIIALHSTLGKYKTEVMKERILDINPDAKVTIQNIFFDKNTLSLIDFCNYDYIIDAIDTVTSKLLLVEIAKKHNIPIISAMGAGNKLDPTQFEVTDIYNTRVCPLCRVMRQELTKRNIDKLKVVYSSEKPQKPKVAITQENRRSTPSSVSFVPPVAGMIIAGEVIKDLIEVL